MGDIASTRLDAIEDMADALSKALAAAERRTEALDEAFGCVQRQAKAGADEHNLAWPWTRSLSETERSRCPTPERRIVRLSIASRPSPGRTAVMRRVAAAAAAQQGEYEGRHADLLVQPAHTDGGARASTGAVLPRLPSPAVHRSSVTSSQTKFALPGSCSTRGAQLDRNLQAGELTALSDRERALEEKLRQMETALEQSRQQRAELEASAKVLTEALRQARETELGVLVEAARHDARAHQTLMHDVERLWQCMARAQEEATQWQKRHAQEASKAQQELETKQITIDELKEAVKELEHRQARAAFCHLAITGKQLAVGDEARQSESALCEIQRLQQTNCVLAKECTALRQQVHFVTRRAKKDMLELEQQLMQLTEEFEQQLNQGGDSVVLQCQDHVVGMAQKAAETEHLLVLHHQSISVQLRAAISELVAVAGQGATELKLLLTEGQSQAQSFDPGDNHRREPKDNHRHDDSRDSLAQPLERRNALQYGEDLKQVEQSEAPDPARQRVDQGCDDSRDRAAQARALKTRDALQCGGALGEVEESEAPDSARQRVCQSVEVDEGKAEVVLLGEKVRKIAIQVSTLVVYMFLITSAYTGGGQGGDRGKMKRPRGTTMLHRMFHVRAGEGANAGTRVSQRVAKDRHQTTWQQISNAAMLTHAKLASERLGSMTAVKSVIFKAAGALRSNEGKRRDGARHRPGHGPGKGKSARMSPAAVPLQASRYRVASAPRNSSSEAQAPLGVAQASFDDQVPGNAASQPAIAEAQDGDEAPAVNDALIAYALVENEMAESGEAEVSLVCNDTQSNYATGRVEMCEAQGGEMVRWRCVMPRKATPTDATPPEEPREEAASRWGARLSRAMRWPWRRVQASAGSAVQEREGWGEKEPPGKATEGRLMQSDLVEDRVGGTALCGATEAMATEVMDHLVCGPSEAETCPHRAVEGVDAARVESVEDC